MPQVTFIHGIANKPAAPALLNIWRASLARDDGIDLGAEGVTSSMVYWADVMYAEPQPDMGLLGHDPVVSGTDPKPALAPA